MQVEQTSTHQGASSNLQDTNLDPRVLPGHCNDVLVDAPWGHHILGLTRLRNRLDEVSIGSRPLELHVLGSIGHLLLQLANQVGRPPRQEQERIVYPIAILDRIHLLAAGSWIRNHLTMEAGTHLLGHDPDRADPQSEMATRESNGRPSRPSTREGAQIPRTVVGHTTNHFEPREGMLAIHAHEHVILVVAKLDVVPGPVPLDQGALQKQGLLFVGGHHEFDCAEDTTQQSNELPRVSMRHEVRTNPGSQIPGFAHVDQIARQVLEQVDAWLLGQRGGLAPQPRHAAPRRTGLRLSLGVSPRIGLLLAMALPCYRLGAFI